MRTERWCYTEWNEGPRGKELYDLQADAKEIQNLVRDPTKVGVLAQLHQLLRTGPVTKQSPIRRLVIHP
jgi:arylsulfatase A-like enzyme